MRETSEWAVIAMPNAGDGEVPVARNTGLVACVRPVRKALMERKHFDRQTIHTGTGTR